MEIKQVKTRLTMNLTCPAGKIESQTCDSSAMDYHAIPGPIDKQVKNPLKGHWI